MSIVLTYLAYLLISVGLAVVAGEVLSRSGRLFLAEALGGSDSAARGITSLIVVSFYLISLGFIVLTMRISGDSVTVRQAIQLLATKIGVVLLVLGGLYLAGIIVITRLRRRLRAQDQSFDLAAEGAPASPARRPALWHPSAGQGAR